MTPITNLTRLDLWLLANCCIAGSRLQVIQLRGASPRVNGLLQFLDTINYKDRETILRQQLTPEDFVRVSGCDPESPRPSPEAEDGSQWTIVHAAELKNLPPQEWIVAGEIPKKGLTVVYGESGVGKSFVTLNYALHIAQSLCVVYIATEGEGGVAKRIAAWCQHHHLGEGQLYFVFGNVSLFERDLFDKLLDDLKRLGPQLIIVDTLAMAFAGGDENSSRDMGVVLRGCREIIRTVITSVMLVHHVNKAGMIERGSGALRGNADMMIKVSPSDDEITVECTKTKDEAPFATRRVYLLPVSTPLGDSLVPVPSNEVLRDSSHLSVTQVKILDVMALEVNRDGITIRDLESQTGISLTTISRTLSNLMKKGLTHKPGMSYAITEAGLKSIINSEPDATPIRRDPPVVSINSSITSSASNDPE